MLGKNRQEPNHVEVDRQEQGRQGTTELPIKNRREVKKQHGALPGHMLFSNMPPLEAVKILCSELATRKTSKKGRDLRMALYDISRAHFYGEAQREIYVTLPPGDEQEGFLRNPKEDYVWNTRRQSCVAAGLLQPSDQEQFQARTSLDKRVQT